DLNAGAERRLGTGKLESRRWQLRLELADEGDRRLRVIAEQNQIEVAILVEVGRQRAGSFEFLLQPQFGGRIAELAVPQVVIVANQAGLGGDDQIKQTVIV